jgi:hypothetical protein
VTPRRCEEWRFDTCIVSARGDNEVSSICYLMSRCMYAADSRELSQDQLDLIHAWFFSRVCLLDPRDRE